MVTATTLPCTHALNLWKKPQGRRRIHGSLPLYYYSYLTQRYTCIYTEKDIIFSNVVELLCVYRARIALPFPQLKEKEISAGSWFHFTLFLSSLTKISFQIGRGRTKIREIFIASDHMCSTCHPCSRESPTLIKCCVVPV